ncbi:MAG: PHB depolymerase family esterase [Cyclobacteriaceae bacterium]|nr:PHB depolymerase family esterase [Cyclobacteriaceae bacterium]
MKQIILCVLVSIISISPLIGQQVAKKAVISQSKEIVYLLYEPLGGEVNNAEKLPLLLFLHGGGESGNNIELVKRHGPPQLVDHGMQFPFYILSPQNQETTRFWDESIVICLLDSIINTYPIDTARIYIAGISRGAYGAWRLVIQYSDKFAALIAISGSAPSPYAKWIGQLPIWAFHGIDDPVIPVSETKQMVKSLKKCGYNPKMTLYKKTGHDAWTRTFSNPEVFEWMLRQKKQPKN